MILNNLHKFLSPLSRGSICVPSNSPLLWGSVLLSGLKQVFVRVSSVNLRFVYLVSSSDDCRFTSHRSSVADEFVGFYKV